MRVTPREVCSAENWLASAAGGSVPASQSAAGRSGEIVSRVTSVGALRSARTGEASRRRRA
jgi:hypothetical protein